MKTIALPRIIDADPDDETKSLWRALTYPGLDIGDSRRWIASSGGVWEIVGVSSLSLKMSQQYPGYGSHLLQHVQGSNQLSKGDTFQPWSDD